VRLSPNEVSVTGTDSIQKLYGGHEPFEREPEFRHIMGGEFADGNIGSLRSREALKVRRLISAPFGRKFLLDQQNLFRECVNENIRRIERLVEDEGEVVDICSVTKLFAFDVLSTFSFIYFANHVRYHCLWRILQDGKRQYDFGAMRT
jgi:hypothetical protein